MDAEHAAEMYAGLFPALYRRFHRRVHHSTYRLTAESLALLHHVAAAGPLTVTELSKHLDRSQAATSEMISRLVGHGVLGRLPDERDRRRVLIWVTEAGRAALDEASKVLSTERLQAAFARLQPDERAALIATTRKLIED